MKDYACFPTRENLIPFVNGRNSLWKLKRDDSDPYLDKICVIIPRNAISGPQR